MEPKTKDRLAMEYAYNLKNSQVENGFKPDESWKLSLVTDIEKAAIERGYYPTLSEKVLPEGLPELLRLIGVQLQKAGINFNSTPVPQDAVLSGLQYIVAFNPGRLR